MSYDKLCEKWAMVVLHQTLERLASEIVMYFSSGSYLWSLQDHFNFDSYNPENLGHTTTNILIFGSWSYGDLFDDYISTIEFLIYVEDNLMTFKSKKIIMLFGPLLSKINIAQCPWPLE